MKKFVCVCWNWNENFPFLSAKNAPLSVSFIGFACRFSHCPWLILCQEDYFDGSTWITATVSHIKLYPYRSKGAAGTGAPDASDAPDSPDSPDSPAMCVHQVGTRLAKSFITLWLREFLLSRRILSGFMLRPESMNWLMYAWLRSEPETASKGNSSGIECA